MRCFLGSAFKGRRSSATIVTAFPLPHLGLTQPLVTINFFFLVGLRRARRESEHSTPHADFLSAAVLKGEFEFVHAMEAWGHVHAPATLPHEVDYIYI
jgi:hypothetical protein